MRMHIVLDDALVADIDRIAGARGRTRFVRRAIVLALEQHLRWDKLQAAAGSVEDRGHAWDDDPATWVQRQRRIDDRRVG